MSHKNSILLVDPEFDPSTAPDCNLLLKITADSFSYAIIDKTSNQLKAVYDQQECHNIPQALSAKLKNDSYLNLAFKEIKVAVYTENSISIPNDLFDANNLDQYAKFFTEEQSDNLYIRPFSSYGFTSIFTLHRFIDETLADSLLSCKLFDQLAPVLAMTRDQQQKSLILDFTASSFNAVVTEGEKLIFRNYYEVANAEEFNYYLLFIINQLQLNTKESNVQLSGIIHENDHYYQCIEKYFKNISFISPLSDQVDHKILDDMPAHYYSSLLALDLCE
ncbi:Protein of unknown function [Pedobacter steynii]|uniref:DUF3822 domain-containing protein n=1 Tax=Pedobacter steynii TaxID=430522 RepID=A0A1G9RRG0_9SPHI|nr:DUF3822 family protein [Pedobacter steynii]NQX37671.1 DUF3822 family protein [Pedobacter steynii]SDM25908.1 Protein of unknown function [Pedobacter steynii]